MVPQKLQQLPVPLGVKCQRGCKHQEDKEKKTKEKKDTEKKKNLSAAQELQVTFTHPAEGPADWSKDCDWTRKVQHRLQVSALHTGGGVNSEWEESVYQWEESALGWAGSAHLQQGPEAVKLAIVGDDLHDVLLRRHNHHHRESKEPSGQR